MKVCPCLDIHSPDHARKFTHSGREFYFICCICCSRPLQAWLAGSRPTRTWQVLLVLMWLHQTTKTALASKQQRTLVRRRSVLQTLLTVMTQPCARTGHCWLLVRLVGATTGGVHERSAAGAAEQLAGGMLLHTCMQFGTVMLLFITQHAARVHSMQQLVQAYCDRWAAGFAADRTVAR